LNRRLGWAREDAVERERPFLPTRHLFFGVARESHAMKSQNISEIKIKKSKVIPVTGIGGL
jgi:hypothetical protein